jgi:glycosyltransferase involved in cell wall biosynthesis
MSASGPRTVLYLIRSWAFGGSHTIILLLMKHLPPERFRVVCVPFDTWSGSDEAFIAEARKRDLPIAEERVPWKSRLNWGRARTTIADLATKYEADLIHTHDTHSTVLVGVGRNRWPCACVASAYGWWDGFLPVRRWVYQKIERQVALPKFDRVITVSNHMKGKVLWGPTTEDRVRVIHTGLDLAALGGGGSREDVRRRLGIAADACVVGTVSRVSVEKGHAHLIDAMALLAEVVPKLHLLILGDGPARPDLEAQVTRLGLTNRVTFTGFFDDLPGALAAMDLLAQPSVKEEGFPTALLEAQAAGLPVVASDIGGVKETIDVKRTGLLVPPGDTAALADVLANLADAPEKREAMGEAAATWIRGTFTLDHMIAQVCDTYDEAIDVHSRNRRQA